MPRDPVRDRRKTVERLKELRELLLYTGASFVALLVDYATYWLLAALWGMELGTAAVVGYIVGLAVSYLLLTRLVFLRRRHAGRPAHEMLLFGASGLLGVALTYFTVSILSGFAGANLHVAKLAAVAVSFVAVYLFRKYVVFGASLQADRITDAEPGKSDPREDAASL